MSRDQFILDIQPKLIVDLFAGGGGMSVAMEMAWGRSPDIAINHNDDALSMHRLNHPQTRHFVADVFEVCPRGATQGRPVGNSVDPLMAVGFLRLNAPDLMIFSSQEAQLKMAAARFTNCCTRRSRRTKHISSRCASTWRASRATTSITGRREAAIRVDAPVMRRI